jgi:hypothetical protein
MSTESHDMDVKYHSFKTICIDGFIDHTPHDLEFLKQLLEQSFHAGYKCGFNYCVETTLKSGKFESDYIRDKIAASTIAKMTPERQEIARQIVKKLREEKK